MPFYMTQVSYTSEAVRALAANPQDRRRPVAKLLEEAGCRLHHYFFAFGEYDAVLIWEGPDNVSGAACLLAVAAGGAVAGMKTTVLMTHEEGMEAFSTAGTVAYSPPEG